MTRTGFAGMAVLLLASCDVAAIVDPIAPEGAKFIANVPEEITSIAASGQDLSAVWLLEEDGCFWYRHAGPVETTLLPLRSTEGRPICTAASS